MAATSLDLSQIRTDAIASAATFRTLIGVYSEDEVDALIDAIDGGAAWGGITGVIADQTDLTAAIAARLSLLSQSGTDTVNQKNGTINQQFRVFGTESGANSEYAEIAHYGVSGVYIGSGKTGTGSKRSIVWHGNGLFFNTGTSGFGTTYFAIDAVGNSTFYGALTAGAATFSGVVTMSAGASIGDWTNWPGIFRVGGGYSAQIARDLIFCFNSANATVGGTPEVGFCRGSSTAFEINNGTLGQYRDLLARSATFSGALNLAGITKTALLALTPNASTGGRWRVTDSSPAQREAYPDGTNWRYTSDDAIVT